MKIPKHSKIQEFCMSIQKLSGLQFQCEAVNEEVRFKFVFG